MKLPDFPRKFTSEQVFSLTVIVMVLAFAAILFGIWTGDERWGFSGLAVGLPDLFAMLIAGLAVWG